jgi:hypothetical protein
MIEEMERISMSRRNGWFGSLKHETDEAVVAKRFILKGRNGETKAILGTTDDDVPFFSLTPDRKARVFIFARADGLASIQLMGSDATARLSALTDGRNASVVLHGPGNRVIGELAFDDERGVAHVQLNDVHGNQVFHSQALSPSPAPSKTPKPKAKKRKRKK